jgi:hypothetical protein
MAGKLWGTGDREGIEASGVYKGVLKEDMVDTVRRVKRPFIDVFVEGLFFEDQDYPLTYVPMVNMVLPLKEGQEVWVYFPQENNARYMVLWKLAEEMGGDFVQEEFDVGRFSKDNVEFPDTEVTKEVFKVSDNMWVICTTSYCVMHYGDSCVLMNAGGVYANAEAFQLVSQEMNLKVLQNLEARIDAAAKLIAGTDLELEAGSSFGIRAGSWKCGYMGGAMKPFLSPAFQQCMYTGASHGVDTLTQVKDS